MPESRANPASTTTPCVGTCVIDGRSGLCLGCLRTLTEIAAWGRLGDGERAALMAELPGRASRVDPATRNVV